MTTSTLFLFFRLFSRNKRRHFLVYRNARTHTHTHTHTHHGFYCFKCISRSRCGIRELLICLSFVSFWVCRRRRRRREHAIGKSRHSQVSLSLQLIYNNTGATTATTTDEGCLSRVGTADVLSFYEARVCASGDYG